MFLTKFFNQIQKGKIKKFWKKKKKLKDKINLKMEIPNDTHDIQGDNEIFSLSKIKTKKVGLLNYINDLSEFI